MQTAPPLPALIGATENALRALLARKILLTSRIKTYPAWVVMNIASNAKSPAQTEDWRLVVANELKIHLDAVHEILDELCAAGLLSEDGELTIPGVAEVATVRSAVSATTASLFEGIEEEEQAIARLVLDRIRHRAEELLRS